MKPVEEFIYRMKFNAKTMTVDVEQVGELIRCRDCKYYNRANDRCEEPYSTAHNLVDGSDYCSRAERKSND